MIYFIQDTIGKWIKIGYTSRESPQERFDQLQTSSAHPLRLLGAMEGEPEDERQLHDRFWEDRVAGEWFRPGAALVEMIEQTFSVEVARLWDSTTGATWLTTGEIAKQFKVHPCSALRWITLGTVLKSGGSLKLPAVRLPGGWRVARSDLNSFLEHVATDRTRTKPKVVETAKMKTKMGPRLTQMRARLKEAGF